MDKVLITGSTGLLGSECVKLFTEKGWEVVGVDANIRAKCLGTPDKTPQYNIDIRNWGELEELFLGYKFNAIIHCAAQASHDYSKADPRTDFTCNAVGTFNLLELTRLHCPDATFVYVSSDKVYGENMKRKLEETDTRWHSDKPFDEKIPLDRAMRTPFGCSKLAGDIYTQEYGLCFGIKTACFRCGCITGKAHEGAELHGFLAYLTKCIKEGKTYRIFGHKGKQVRDQIHAHDLATAFYHFIQNPKIAEVYNMGGERKRSVSVLEAISMIESRLGKKAITEYVDEPRQGDRQWDVHSTAKFRSDYPDWEYEYSLEKIIDELCGQ